MSPTFVSPNINKMTTWNVFQLTVGVLFLDDFKIGLLFSAYYVGYCICFPIFLTVGDRSVRFYILKFSLSLLVINRVSIIVPINFLGVCAYPLEIDIF